MGGGAFRFFGINIYQVALYINTHRAAASPVLRPFLGQDVAALQQNETFYQAMMSGQVRGGRRRREEGLEEADRKGGRAGASNSRQSVVKDEDVHLPGCSYAYIPPPSLFDCLPGPGEVLAVAVHQAAHPA